MTVAHVAVNVKDWGAAKQFYEAVLGPLGYRIVYEEDGALAYFADPGGLDFGMGRRDPPGGAHVAFECADRETVDRFYETALGAGGRDNGPPGIRPQYDANYYAAYVLDPDGNNIEAVCHEPPES
jgi:catechol 2,3-dioxygenase-like lactoylglutathione lyase family enzyme